MAEWPAFVAFLLAFAGDALAHQPQCVIPRRDLVNAQARAVVSASATGFDYSYAVTNKADAQQTLFSFAVEALTTQPPVQRSPQGWDAGGPIAASSLFVWDPQLDPGGLPPGTSASGFGFTSDGLPTIVRFLAWGAVELPPSQKAGRLSRAPTPTSSTIVSRDQPSGRILRRPSSQSTL